MEGAQSPGEKVDETLKGQEVEPEDVSETDVEDMKDAMTGEASSEYIGEDNQ